MSNYITLVATVKQVKPYKKEGQKERYIVNFSIPCSSDVVDILTDDNIFIEGEQYVLLIEGNRFGLRAKIVCPYNN